MQKTEGYILVAVGEHYIEESCDFIKTLRKFNDLRPVSVLTVEKDIEFALSKNIFDKVVLLNTKNKLYDDCKLGFEKNCLFARLVMDDYLIYDHSIVLDTDILCISNTERMWSTFKNFDQCVQRIGTEHDPSWHWGHVTEVSKRVGKNVPHSHGGLTYIRRDELIKNFYETTRQIFYDYEIYGCKSYFRESKTEEIIFAIAFAKFDFLQHDFFQKSIMAFNIKDQELPCYTQNAMNKVQNLKQEFILAHMCHSKKGTKIYDSLLKKILCLKNN